METVSNKELVLKEDLVVPPSDKLILRDSKILFKENTGIVCSGELIIENSKIGPINKKKGWNNISGYKAKIRVVNSKITDGRGIPGPKLNEYFNESYFDNRYGGGILIAFGTLTLENSEILNCHSDLYGGGISASDSQVTIRKCSFKNLSSRHGGAVIASSRDDNDPGKLIIQDSTFEQTNAKAEGGIIKAHGVPVLINQCTFNNSTCRKGNISVTKSKDFHLQSSRFQNLQAEAYGGAVHVYISRSIIDNSTFIHCQAVQLGGAIFVDERCISEITGCDFIQCSAGRMGGALFFESPTTISNCTFEECFSPTGAAIGKNLLNPIEVKCTNLYDVNCEPAFSNISGCSGKKMKPDINKTKEGPDEDKIYTCPDCEGLGKIAGQVCSLCKGNKKVIFNRKTKRLEPYGKSIVIN